MQALFGKAHPGSTAARPCLDTLRPARVHLVLVLGCRPTDPPHGCSERNPVHLPLGACGHRPLRADRPLGPAVGGGVGRDDPHGPGCALLDRPARHGPGAGGTRRPGHAAAGGAPCAAVVTGATHHPVRRPDRPPCAGAAGRKPAGVCPRRRRRAHGHVLGTGLVFGLLPAFGVHHPAAAHPYPRAAAAAGQRAGRHHGGPDKRDAGPPPGLAPVRRAHGRTAAGQHPAGAPGHHHHDHHHQRHGLVARAVRPRGGTRHRLCAPHTRPGP